MTSRTVRSLPQLLSFVVDNRGRTCPTSDSGIPLIATNCLKEGKREAVFENIRYVDDRTYATWFRAHPKPGDILFVCKGSPGRVALVPDPVPYCIAQDMVALRADAKIIDANYLYYRLRSPDVQEAIGNMHVGTMIPHFKKGDFGKLRFAVHDNISEQQAIARLLAVLDDKVSVNEHVVNKVDELARFTWLLACKSGFAAPLSSLARFVNGKAFTKDASGSGRVVIRIAELNSGIGNSTVYNDIEVSEDNLARPGDLLFAWSGSLTVSRWFREEAIVNQHIFKVIPISGHPIWLINQALCDKLQEFKSIAADKATTMGHIQRRHLDGPVTIPPQDQLSKIDGLMSALWKQALAAEQENLRLESTRDQLLSLLMSDKVRVRDVEKAVEEVV
jgi:type I restriction enzyme S subunit